MVIVTKYVPAPKWVLAINICGIIFARRPLNETQTNHELIHSKQCWEMLIIGFYLAYLIDWLIKLVMYGKNAYRNISFEREAYENENNLNYLKNRKFWAWLKYV